MMVGAAVAAGYVLGSMGGNDEWYDRPMSADYNQFSGTPRPVEYPAMNYSSSSGRNRGSQPNGEGLLSQFDDEINMLKSAAVVTLTNLLRDSIREYVPALGQQLDRETKQRGQNRSTAPNTSMDYESSTASANYEGIPETTAYGSNTVARQSEQGRPYYPPGSSATSTSDRDYVKTYHPPTEAGQERSVGDETRY